MIVEVLKGCLKDAKELIELPIEGHMHTQEHLEQHGDDF
jgi:hypothetical protein